MRSADEATLVDTVHGTRLYACAAAGTEVVVDGCEVVLNSDSAVGTGLLALHTADTAVRAVLTCVCALVGVRALNNNAYGIVKKVNDAVGALTNADATADTLLRIYTRYAILDSDSVLRTNRYTVTVAEAGEGAELVAAVRHISGKAGLYALIFVLLFIDAAGAVAGYEGNLLDNVLSLNAEDSRDISRSLVTAGNTEVGLVGGLFSESLCVAVASGVAAGAAGGAGQTVTDSNEGLVLLNAEENVSDGKDSGSEKSDANTDKSRGKGSLENFYKHVVTSLNSVVYNTLEAEECKSNDGCGYESDGNTLKTLGSGAVLNSGAYACEEDHRYKEAYANAERANHGLDEVTALGDVLISDTENGTVGGDKGEIYAERLVQRRDELLENDLYELNKSCDNENEYDGLKVLELTLEKVLKDRPGCRGSAKHYEDNRNAHARRLLELLGYAKEGADTGGLSKNVVVGDDTGKKKS